MITIATLAIATSGVKTPRCCKTNALSRLVLRLKVSGVKLQKFGPSKFVSNQTAVYSYPQNNVSVYSFKSAGIRFKKSGSSKKMIIGNFILKASCVKLKSLGSSKFVNNQTVVYNYPQSNALAYSFKSTGVELSKFGASKLVNNQVVTYAYAQTNTAIYSFKSTGVESSKIGSSKFLLQSGTGKTKGASFKLSKLGSSSKQSTVLGTSQNMYLNLNAMQPMQLKFTSLNYAKSLNPIDLAIQFWS